MSYPLHILLIDDCIEDGEFYKRLLKKNQSQEYNLTQLLTGKEAVEYCVKQAPDCMLLDYNLPDIDGIELLQIFAKHPSLHLIPRIMLTGQGNEAVAIKAMKAGALDYLPKTNLTLEQLTHAISNTIETASLLSHVKNKNEEMEYLASHDDLTKLANRRYFEKALDRNISYANRHRSLFALLLIDLDHFKTINDSLGHQAGDLLLCEVARRFQACLRQEDFTARIGGDEFAIVLTNIASTNDAGKIANKVLQTLSAPFFIDGNKVHTDASIGVACYPSVAENTSELIKHADVAMYRAKEYGRGCYQYFTREFNSKHLACLDMENALCFALENEELFLQYQPIVSLHTNKIVGVEALLRWENKQFGVVSPEIFLPIAEKTGVVGELTQWVITQSFQQFVEWRPYLEPNVKLAINVLANAFNSNSFLNTLYELTQKSGIDCEQIEIEITETAIMQKIDLAKAMIEKLHNLGFRIAIDNFGAGYFSLNRLKELPINTLKIDKSFVCDLAHDTSSGMIIKSIVQLAANMAVNVICEGVETQQQIDILVEHKMPNAQGFYFCGPSSAKEIELLLREKNPSYI